MRNLRTNRRGEITASIGLFITLCVFLSLAGWLLGNMPGTLATGPANDLGYEDAPEVFDFLDLTEYLDSQAFSMGDTGHTEDWGKAEFGHDMRIQWSGFFDEVFNAHLDGFLLSPHAMKWKNENGTIRAETFLNGLSVSEMVEDANSENVSYYIVYCEHFSMEAWITYNQTTYTSYEDAWANDELDILFTIGFDEAGTRWNAWSIIGSILTFKTLDIGPPFLTYILSITFYIAIAGLMIVILTSVWPFG